MFAGEERRIIQAATISHKLHSVNDTNVVDLLQTAGSIIDKRSSINNISGKIYLHDYVIGSHHLVVLVLQHMAMPCIAKLTVLG